jgi:hypothetical protein
MMCQSPVRDRALAVVTQLIALIVQAARHSET